MLWSGPKMNVVFMGNFPYPHGMASTRRVQYFIDYLVSQNIFPRILLLRQGGQRVPKSKLKGDYAGVHYVTTGYGLSLSFSALYKLPLYFWVGFTTLAKWKKKNFINCLYCYNGPNIENVFFLLFAKFFGYYVIFDIVEDFAYTEERLHLLARLKNQSIVLMDRYVLKIAEGLVLISQYLKDKYDRRNQNLIPIQLIPISARCNRNNRKKPLGGPVKFAYAGSFAKKDGVENLIRAFKRVYRKNSNCMLLLTGAGMNLKEIKRQIEGNNVIKYLGYLEDNEFYEFLQEADVLCITRTDSKFANAGFPFKLGEYLATGNPVITSNVGDVRLYLKDMEDALVVDPGEVNAIERAMEYCINNPGTARKIGENGRHKCEQFFNPEINGELFIRLLNALGQKKRCSRNKARK
jgi:glycosyltransferase involved in cell wall biosynthesis